MASRRPGATERSSAPRQEHWGVAAPRGDLAQLDIPADAGRERTFEIYCSFVVARRSDQTAAAHALRVLVDGAQQWSRRVPTAAGPSDSLDVRLRRTVGVGLPLRVTAVGDVEGAVPLRLAISADED